MRTKLKRKLCIVTLVALLLLIINFWQRNLEPQLKADKVKQVNNDNKNNKEVMNKTVEPCDSIHVATICAGYESSRQLVTLLKSVLFYRTKSLHLHVVVDEISEHILTNLFRTWDLPDFVVSFYPDTRLLPEVSWISNSHYSGIYGLLKLKLPDVLSSEISRVIVVDTDLLFNHDISQLWNFFAQFRDRECIGLVENLSEWYLGTMLVSEDVWPAIGRGFNTGVILLDLDLLKTSNWASLWAKVTKEVLLTHQQTQLADQDVLNAVIYFNPHLVHKLPCVWNYQLSNNMREDFCRVEAFNVERAKVYHWNSPEKQQSKHAHTHGANNLYQRFLDLNGALVKEPLIRCGEKKKKSTSLISDYEDDEDTEDLCQKLIQSTSLHRIHLYYIPYDNRPDSKDITLVVQLSMDRLTTLEKLCKNWPGPVSVAIFTSDQDAQSLPVFIEQSAVLASRMNIGYHLVFQSTHDDIFPINLLRNIALQQATTEFVFLCDVDFIPMPHLYTYLRSILEESDTDKKAFIIPAFESLYYRADLPKTKSELVDLYKEERVTSFRSYVWEQGHAPTNFTRWFQSDVPYTVKWRKDFEPYIAIRKDICPYYDKQFAGFGWNKVTHIMELDAAGFEFVVLPHGFIVHIPHEPSIYLMRYRSHKLYRECLHWYKLNFIKYLTETYNIEDSDKYGRLAVD